jgi:predicted TIM-barrel fold metal-dependent hydrolase
VSTLDNKNLLTHSAKLNRRTFVKCLYGILPLAVAEAGPWLSSPLAADRRLLIWDVHCHLNSVPGETPEERMAKLIQHMDRLGISRVMLSLGSVLDEDPSPERLREHNDEVLRALRPWPSRAFGFVYLNPNHVDFSLKEFDRCVRDGPMVGVKLWVAKRCNAPELDPIIERAATSHAAILQHTWLKVGGNLQNESTPYDLVELAGRHPKVPLICGHAGGDWEKSIRIVRATKNISIELAGSDPTSGLVEMAVRELGAERVLFGSDAGGRSFASQLGKLMGAEIPEAARKLILGENLHRMLLPILKAKRHQV